MTPNRVFTTHAIVLKRANMGEADRIVTIFSREYGRMKVIAKGIRRIHSRRAPYLEVFCNTLLVLHRGKTWDIVTEASSLQSFDRLRTALPRISTAYYLCELVDVLLPERQGHRNVYTLLLGALRALNDISRIDPIAVIEQFSLELLQVLGYLAGDRVLPSRLIEPYIERIIEKRLRTPKILSQLSATISS